MNTESVEDCYELSPIQQDMLFHYLCDGHSGVDIAQMVIELHEPLYVLALEKAWQLVVERHAALRTGFRWQDLKEPVQEVRGGIRVSVARYDWCTQSAAEQADRTEAYLGSDRQRGFDLEEAPLMRIALFQLGKDEFRLIWTFHRILLDNRSCVIILNEVFGLYEAICRCETLELDSPRPYREYVEWIKRLDLSGAAEFWKEKLKGFSAPTPLLLDRDAGSATEQNLFGEEESQLPQALSSALKSLAERENLRLNTVIQGAWGLLLSRYSDEEDIFFGAAQTARRSTVDGAESIVGQFLNTVPVRMRISEETTVLNWLKQLRSEWVPLRGYDHAPLAKIKEWSETSAGAPLFNSLVVFEDQRFDSVLRSEDRRWQSREVRLLEQTNYPLTLRAYGSPEVLLKVEYDRRRFEHSTITRMLGHLRTLLEGVAARPTQLLLNLPLLTEAERRQLLVEWNDTQADYPRNSCLHELIEAQVERSRETVALIYEEQQLTYGEMNARANQLARHLRALGVGPEVCVGICMERSPEMVLGLLGILKAGGAYVPLDPAYPKERLAFMLADSGVPVLLTQRRLLETLPRHGARVLCLDPEWWASAKESPENPLSAATPEDLAYVIYTSGSTGRPKGVQVPHRGLCNLVETQVRTCGVRPGDRVLHFCSLSFDPSIFEIGMALRSGATLVVARRSSLLPGPALAHVFRDHAVTTIVLPPSVLSPLPDKPFPSLQTLVIGAEPVTAEFVKRWGNGRRIFNIYGATETTVFSTIAACRTDGRKPSIGRPIANTQIYLLDRHLRLVPVGVPGELYVGGAGLARGYLNRPELTAERFIPDPFGNEPGARLYRTGDLARYLPDGDIDFLGRVDYQVKVRGHRIELEEIEAVLAEHPGVREGVVVTREDVPGAKRLVAYVVPQREQAPTLSELRSWLKAKLPDYMVPSAFVMLDTLPLSPNGKVDRRALAAHDSSAEPRGSFVAPRDVLELTLTQIWEKLLNLPSVGVTDSFFDLGGHSLLAARFFNEIYKTFGKDLPFSTLFQEPTIEHLANMIRQEEVVPSPCLAIQRFGSRPPFFAVGSHPGYVNLSQYLGSDQPFYRLDLYALQEQRLNEGRELFTTFEAMAAHLVEEMQALQPVGPYFLGGGCEGGIAAFEIARQLRNRGQQVAMLAIWETPPSENWHMKPWYYFVRLARGVRFLLKHGPKKLGTTIVDRIRNKRVLDSVAPGVHADRHHQIKTTIGSAVRKYVSQPYQGRIILFRASEHLSEFPDPTQGWNRLASQGTETYVIPGNHSTYFERHLLDFAEHLKSGLDEAAREAELRNRTPVVSVIMPAYNAARYIGEALDSVFAQTFPDFEVIVVNDGSPDTDELERVIESYQQHVNYIKRPNGGPGAARNTAILHAKGEYVAFLDSDDLWLPNYLAEQLKALRENPELDLIYADALLVGDSALAGRTYMQTCPSRGAVTFESLLVEDCAVITSCAVALRQSLVDIGLFNEDRNLIGCEDFDLWIRLAFHGAHIGYQQRVLARHRLHHDSLAARSTRMLQTQIELLRKTACTLTLSSRRQELLAREITKCEAHIDLDRAKQRLLAGEYTEAMEAFAKANDFFRSRKLSVVLQLLRRVPNFLRYAYVIYEGFTP